MRFEVAGQAAFAIRYQGHVYAYLNQCRHIPVEMDYRDGDFLIYQNTILSVRYMVRLINQTPDYVCEGHAVAAGYTRSRLKNVMGRSIWYRPLAMERIRNE